MSQPSSSSPAPPPTLPPNPRDARRPAGEPVRLLGSPLTLVLIGACVVVALLSRFGADKQALRSLFISLFPLRPAMDADGTLFAGALLPEVLRGGQLWRVLTPIFIHYGPMHLFFNMFWLKDLGGLLEQRYGALRFGALVVGVGLFSNLAEYFLGPSTGFGGMSGVVYGLFGYIWVQGRLDPAGFGFALTSQTVLLMMAWFVLCFTGLLGPIANYAHAGGLVAGALAGWVVAQTTMRDVLARRREFRAAVENQGDEPLHRCHACGRTERDADGTLDFRVSSADGEEYCEEHLPARRGG